MSMLKSVCWLGVLVLLASGAAAAAWWAGLLGKSYTATASLQLARCEPHFLPDGAEKYDPLEFESFCNDQAALIKDRFVIAAALHDPRLKKRGCAARADARHEAIGWLTKAIRVEFAPKNSGIMRVSATQPNREDAAAMVNAVVKAYWDEVVDRDRQQRRDRLTDLTTVSAEKENEVRTQRERLKRELEASGAGDDESMKARAQLAINTYAEFVREFQTMRAEHRTLQGKRKLAREALAELRDFEIPEVQVAAILNKNPVYRDLQSRLAMLESNGPYADKAASAAEEPPGLARIKAELNSRKAQLQNLETDARRQIREARRIELENEAHRLEKQLELSAEQLIAFEKEVERQRNEADSVGRSSVAAQMQRAEVENMEQILRNVATERERLRVELRSPPRVKVLGDPSAPAAVPEGPD